MDIAAQADVITGPLQIGIDITNHCMLQCLHCFNRSAKIKRIEMTDAELNRLADQIVSIRPQQICICGGEPLIRKRQTIEFGRKIKESGILIGMVSNGFLLTSDIGVDFGESTSVCHINPNVAKAGEISNRSWNSPLVRSRNKTMIQLSSTPTVICEIFFIFLLNIGVKPASIYLFPPSKSRLFTFFPAYKNKWCCQNKGVSKE